MSHPDVVYEHIQWSRELLWSWEASRWSVPASLTKGFKERHLQFLLCFPNHTDFPPSSCNSSPLSAGQSYIIVKTCLVGAFKNNLTSEIPEWAAEQQLFNIHVCLKQLLKWDIFLTQHQTANSSLSIITNEYKCRQVFSEPQFPSGTMGHNQKWCSHVAEL